MIFRAHDQSLQIDNTTTTSVVKSDIFKIRFISDVNILVVHSYTYAGLNVRFKTFKSRGMYM